MLLQIGQSARAVGTGFLIHWGFACVASSVGNIVPATPGPSGFKLHALLLFRCGETNRPRRQLPLKRDFDAHSCQEEEAQGKKQWVGQWVEGARGKHGQEPLLWLLWERQDRRGNQANDCLVGIV